MKLKQPNETPGNGGFLFVFESPKTKEQVRVMAANGVSQLTDKAATIMRKNGMEVPTNLREIIEHQICLRQSFPMQECWSGGIGDTLHHKWIKPFLTVVEGKANKLGIVGRAVARVAKAVKSCGGCSGRKVFREGQNSLGRAGVLNKVGNRVFTKLKK